MTYTDLYLDTYGSTMALRRMFDAAFPPTNPPKWEAAAGYIGGNTPHVWTDAEWARQPARWRLPIFTRSVGGDPSDDAAASVRWLRAHSVPEGVCVALDFETRIDSGYLNRFDDLVVAAGWRTMVYGTRRTVVRNPEPSGGYWMAEWTGTPHLIPGSAATQWSGSEPFSGAYDPNLVADSTPLWDIQEEDMTTEEHDALMWLRANVVALRDQGVRMTDHGDPVVAGRGNHLAQVRADIAALRADVDTLKQAQDPATLAALLAGQLEIVGIQTDTSTGVVSVQFGPKPA